jgi:probable LLM family oxidoreductase
MPQTLAFGLDTFGDVTHNASGALSHAQVIRNLVDEAELADRVGVDFFGLGEHHRSDFAVSAPEPILGAIAVRTKRIRMGTAVTVLSSDDPIRLYQRFATLNALSEGRAEIILGRGSFTESFPLFGFDLSDYETLFEEKLDLFSKLLTQEKVSWKGTHRPALKATTVYPRPESPIKTWIGVGGSPESIIRAASHDLPVILAIIGGSPARFKPYVDLYHQAHEQMGTKAQPMAVHSPGHVGPSDQEAKDRFYPGYKAMHDHIGASRGWPPLRREDFEREIEHGSLYVGSPETVAQKIAKTVKVLNAGQFNLKYSAGPVSHHALMDCIDLYGSKVIPRVQELLA